MMAAFSAVAADLFSSRGIDPEVAAAAGVFEDGGDLVYPSGRRRGLTGGGHRQPAGQKLAPWTPVGVEGAAC